MARQPIHTDPIQPGSHPVKPPVRTQRRTPVRANLGGSQGAPSHPIAGLDGKPTPKRPVAKQLMGDRVKVICTLAERAD